MRALVTTTIHVPHALKNWRATLDFDGRNEDVMIVVGDQKSPHAEIMDFLATLPGGLDKNRYIGPSAQQLWGVSTPIGWNCIQRRNIGFLEAALLKPDIVFTVDDDNIPHQGDYAAAMESYLTEENEHFGQVVRCSTGWFNIAKLINVRHRGYPHSRWNDADEIPDFRQEVVSKIGVVASFWSGAPDIDAIERMCCDPEVPEVMLPEEPYFLAPNTWSPFNSQATAFRTELLPAMLMWPAVGRFDDIWASYVTRRVMDQLGMYAAHGFPNVHQDRNPHDNLTDLKAELFGYEFNEHIIDIIRGTYIPDTTTSVKAMVGSILREVYDLPFIPGRTKDSFVEWMADLDRVEAATGVNF